MSPDEALPEHPSVIWRKRDFPKLVPKYQVGSILSVPELVALGLGVGVVHLFLGEGRKDLVRLTDPLPECETELWVLTHPDARHLRRVGAVYFHLGWAKSPAMADGAQPHTVARPCEPPGSCRSCASACGR